MPCRVRCRATKVLLVGYAALALCACGAAEPPTREAPAGFGAATGDGRDAGAVATLPAPTASAAVAPAGPDASAASATKASLEATAAPPSVEEPNATRRIKYFVKPDGVTVEVDGVSLVPAAELVKSRGGWAVRIRVEARAKDGGRHVLLAPKDAELAVAGTVKRAGSEETESFTDRRGSEREVVVQGPKPAKLSRVWPGQGQPLALGDQVSLRIGLWGLGADLASGRPLTRFCQLSVRVDPARARKGSIVLEAPEGAEGARPAEHP